jgi:hypothetical protein
VAPEDAVDVERRRREFLHDPGNLRRRHEQEHGIRVDEAADQPGTGDAVDLRAGAGDPDGASLRIARRQFFRGNDGEPGPGPALDAALQRVGRGTRVAEPGRHALAEFQPLLADHHDGAAGKLSGPVRGVGIGAAHRTGDEAWRGGKILVAADVDEDRAFRRADEARQLFSGDGVDRRHG